MSAKTILQGWCHIGYDNAKAFQQSYPNEDRFNYEFDSVYGGGWTPEHFAVIAPIGRAWFWYRVGYRRFRRQAGITEVDHEQCSARVFEIP